MRLRRRSFRVFAAATSLACVALCGAPGILLGYQTKLADQSLVAAARARAKVASDAIAAATFSA
jgi:hypothetical protein